MNLLGRRILFLSPHPDDIAFSCGGFAAWCAERTNAHLHTLFGQSRYSTEPLAAPDSARISELRYREDRDYARLLGASYSRDLLPDSSLRGYSDETELGAWMPSDPIGPRVRERLQLAVAGVDPAIVVAPLAIGRHIDHELVLWAAETLDRDLLYYEDLPYAAKVSSSVLNRSIEERGYEIAFDFDIMELVGRKLKGIRVYQSQIDLSIEDIIMGHAREIGGSSLTERLWRRM